MSNHKKPRAPLKRFSDKRMAQMTIYFSLRKKFLRQHPKCTACTILRHHIHRTSPEMSIILPALQGGFPPNTISTDLHTGSVLGMAYSMQNTMSKFLCMGMPLQEVIWRSTSRAAELIRRPELGTLTPGAEADLAVFELHERKNNDARRFSYMDCGRARLTGDFNLECLLTLRAGLALFDPTGLTMPEWVNAPAPYWVNPTEK